MDAFISDLPSQPSSGHKKRSPGYRTGDLILNRQDILSSISFTNDSLPIPIVQRVEAIELPSIALPFSKVVNKSASDTLVVFYEPDINFARILHNPKRYVNSLRRFPCVVGPDFSQKIGMNPSYAIVTHGGTKPLRPISNHVESPWYPMPHGQRRHRMTMHSRVCRRSLS